MPKQTIEPSLPSVLVVDDEPLVRSFVRDALRARAWVVEAGDGDAAIGILQQEARESIDLVLLDHLLPGRSGLDVLRLARRQWPWIPVVLLTGVGSEDLAADALRAGASDYLKKPVGVETLLNTVETLTSARTPPPAPPELHRRHADRPMHPNIRRALDFIREHFTEPIALGDAAREAGLSRYHFCRLFHHEVSMTFHDYVQALRVNRAKVMLANSRLRVSEIAYAVGFNDLSHFDRTFRRLVGQSPTAYRSTLGRCA